MSNPFQSTYIHKHYHYHYHCDVNDTSLLSNSERYSSPSIRTPQKSSILPTKSSWKNRINPEITQLYEDVSNQSSLEDTFTPKASRQPQDQAQQFRTVKQTKHSKYPNSKQDLLKNIQDYEKYLRQHSRPNLYIPNTSNLKKLSILQQNLPYINETVSLNDFLQINDKSQKHQDDMMMTRASSKLISTKQQFEIGDQQRQTFQKYDLKISSINIKNRQQMSGYQKIDRKSQIKSPQKNTIFDNVKVRMSHTQDPSKHQSKEQLENSYFSLFQRQAQKQSGSEKNAQSKNQLVSVDAQRVQLEQQQERNEKFDRYAYQLMKEQCKFLRNKFIEHIENKHQITL